MGFTNYGKQEVAMLLTGSRGIPQYCAVGTGSGVFNANTGSLYSESLSRVFYTERDSGIPKKVTLQFDYGSVQLSGLLLREFGISPSSNIGSLDLFSHEHFPSIEFDGTNEAQISITFEVF